MIPYQDLNRTRHFPVVTLAIIALNLAAFAVELSLRGPEATAFLYRYAVIPDEFRIGHNLPISAGPAPFATLFTGLFLHGGFLHLFGNMLYLWIFGDNVEDRMGPFRFLIFYLVCGILAFLAQIYSNFDSRIPSLGASGAIAGVLASYLVQFPRARVKVLVPVFYFLRTVILPAWLVLGGWLLLQIVAVRFSPVGATGGVAYYAHIGGFVAGLLLTPAFQRSGRR